MKNQRILITVSVLFFLGLVCGGCGTLSKKMTLEPGVTGVPNKQVEVGSVENASKVTIEFDFASFFKKELETALKKYQVPLTAGDNKDRLILRSRVVEYEPGNAFKRWLLPGYGNTVCAVSVEISDAASSKQLGTLKVRRVVMAGGLYTVGAHQTVFREVARAVAKQLKEEMAV